MALASPLSAQQHHPDTAAGEGGGGSQVHFRAAMRARWSHVPGPGPSAPNAAPDLSSLLSVGKTRIIPTTYYRVPQSVVHSVALSTTHLLNTAPSQEVVQLVLFTWVDYNLHWFQ